MKILHVCLASFYIDNFSYQENLLPKYHMILGHEVKIIASLVSFDLNGKPIILKKTRNYVNENNISVKRLEFKKTKFSEILRLYVGTYDSISEYKPDIIFIHGCQFLDIYEIIRYLDLNPVTKVYVDNHADFSNSARNFFSRNILHRIIWKRCAQSIKPFVSKFYGVMPSRVDFLHDVYGIPLKEIDLLVMGADDEQVNNSYNPDNMKEIKKLLSICSEDFIIVSGGKLDNAKRQILLLMNAIKEIEDKKVKLIVFGSVTVELKKEFNELLVPNKVIYLGWLNQQQSYQILALADLAVFPGRHSVYWEQAVGMGIPCIFKYWKGTTHVDVGGNCKFLYTDSVEEIRNNIQDILNNKNTLIQMKESAYSSGRENFLYSNISKRSLED